MDTDGEMGHATDVRRKWLKFDGRKPHCVTPFRGRRYTLVFFTYSNPQKSTSLSRQEEEYLRALAFPLPAQVCSNRASAAVSRPLPCPTLSVQAARYSFQRFKQKVAARGGLRRKALIVQVGKSKIRVMVSSSMPLKLANEAVPHGKASARLFAGSLRFLTDEAAVKTHDQRFENISIARGVLHVFPKTDVVRRRLGGPLQSAWPAPNNTIAGPGAHIQRTSESRWVAEAKLC
ncbi:unnamed protein product [Symbiodinium necroappetens]|uniref:Uncharacterized protein n=1 Tax=Symbiodinium necroappetens TaxID=1628268 RepID=A0A813C002_9DINO|nr:unnamed protein product [Symbiodinium necroappetens]